MTALPSRPPSRLVAALHGLDQVLDSPRRSGVALGNWRWLVRQRTTAVRTALMDDAGNTEDGWLAARGGTGFGERNALLGRLTSLAPQVLQTPDVETLRIELKRLVADIRRHAQPGVDRPG